MSATQAANRMSVPGGLMGMAKITGLTCQQLGDMYVNRPSAFIAMLYGIKEMSVNNEELYQQLMSISAKAVASDKEQERAVWS